MKLEIIEELKFREFLRLSGSLIKGSIVLFRKGLGTHNNIQDFLDMSSSKESASFNRE